jgi:hypothetical protein
MFPQLHELEGDHTIGDLLDLAGGFEADDEKSKNPGIYLTGVIGGMLSDETKTALKPEKPAGGKGKKEKVPKKKGPAKGGPGNGYSQFVKAVGAARKNKDDERTVVLRTEPVFGAKSKSPDTYKEFSDILVPFLDQEIKLTALTDALEFGDVRDKKYTVYASGVFWGMCDEATQKSFNPPAAAPAITA